MSEVPMYGGNDLDGEEGGEAVEARPLGAQRLEPRAEFLN